MNEEQNFRQTVDFSAHQPAPYLLLLLLLLTGYINSFQAEWHYDDLPNILENSPLHLTELTAASIKRTFFAYPGQQGTLLRPVSNLTFALNWFFHQDRVFGYHVANFFIHLLTAVFLYKSCLLLLITPKNSNRYYASRNFIATLAAILWAVNPIQTQAVTYIVQRMASLAAMFTIIGIWCYLEARMLPLANIKKQILYYAAAFLSFLLALGSKENAVLFPASVVLIELFFFRQDIKITKQNILLLLAGFIFILGFTLLLKPEIFQSIFAPYVGRSFTPSQRLLTQPRIIIFYLSQIFYPAPFRLSLTHDIELSTSLFCPLTTLPSILLLLLLIILPFIYHKSYPIISFAILFFLLNHSVESTFLNLELIFEHRNYLPSLFLFLPIAAALSTSINQYRQRSRLVFVTLSATTAILIVLFILGTMARNRVWLTELNLWTDSLEKAPRHSRSYVNLAHNYLYKENNLKKAFELNFLSLDKDAPNPWKARLAAYSTMGYIMFRLGNHKAALKFYNQALVVSEDKPYGDLTTGVLSDKAATLWNSGQKEQALMLATDIAQAKPEKGAYLQQHGEMLVGMNHVAEGMAVLRRVFAHSDMMSEEYRKTLLDFSLVYARLGSMQKSALYARMADMLDVPVVPSSLCFIEASLLAGKSEKADQAMRLMLSKITWSELIEILEENSPDTPVLPLNYPLLRQYAAGWIARQRE